MKKRSLIVLTSTLFTVFIFTNYGCNKDEDSNENPPTGKADFNVSLKSSAKKSTYESIFIDISKVSIHTSTDSSSTTGWQDLETNLGVYDLLDYASGNDTIIAFDSVLQLQTVSQIRLILGIHNTIVENGDTFDLETPSAQTAGLKIQIHAELQPDVSYKVVLDFDADDSIIKTGNDKYKLKPVINATVIQQ